VYVGATQNFHARALQHRQQLFAGAHSNKEMQKDFDNGYEFAFAILENMGDKCEKDKVLFREKQHIYAFKKNYIKTYNHETMEQLRNMMFWEMSHELHFIN
jgi:hypothetical protein